MSARVPRSGAQSAARTVGGGFCNVIISTFMGGYLANGAWPCASSRSVMPSDLRGQAISGSQANLLQAGAPDVGLLVVSVGLLHDLGSHPAIEGQHSLKPNYMREQRDAPARRANKGLMCAGTETAEAGRSDSVVRQLHVAMIVDQNVASLREASAAVSKSPSANGRLSVHEP